MPGMMRPSNAKIWVSMPPAGHPERQRRRAPLPEAGCHRHWQRLPAAARRPCAQPGATIPNSARQARIELIVASAVAALSSPALPPFRPPAGADGCRCCLRDRPVRQGAADTAKIARVKELIAKREELDAELSEL